MSKIPRLFEMMSAKNLKPSKISELYGIPTSNFTEWKQGRMPSPERLAQLAEILETSTDYLLGKTDNPSPLSEIKENPHGLSEEDLHMFEKINAMPKEQQDIIKNLIDQLHSKNNP